MIATILAVVLCLYSAIALRLGTKQCKIAIVGGGPAGLTAALSLQKLGYTDITLLEKARYDKNFDPLKSYSMLLEGRSRPILKEVGAWDEIQRQGLPWDGFGKITTFNSDKSIKINDKQIGDPSWNDKYLLLRNNLANILYDKVLRTNSLCDNNINVIQDGTCTNFQLCKESGELVVDYVLGSGGGEKCQLFADLVIGCDGISSIIRRSLANDSFAGKLDDTVEICDTGGQSTIAPPRLARRFSLRSHRNPSSGVRYVMLPVQPSFALPIHDNKTVNVLARMPLEPSRMYRIPSIASPADRALEFRLYATKPNMPRTASLARVSNHVIWNIKSLQELKRYLQRMFPQLDPIEQFVSDQDWEKFLSFEPGVFPSHQHVLGMQAVFRQKSSGSAMSAVVLLGDAAHAFPPDVGQGVAAALADVNALYRELQQHGEDIPLALFEYEKRQLPEARALWRISSFFSFPFQNGQQPNRAAVAIANLLFINKLRELPLLKDWIPPSPFRLVHTTEMTFAEIMKSFDQSRARLFATIGLGVGFIALKIFV